MTSPSLVSAPEVLDLGHGIHCIDTLQGKPGMACCYLIRSGDEAALIECGTSPGVPALLAAIQRLGVERRQLRYVMPTHVHLDHAGGAGRLMQELPQARLVVHPRGARHLIDPSRLIAGATAVYGEDVVRASYGEILPIAADRVIEAGDGFRLSLGGRELLFIDSPGHARHHYSIWDAQSRGFFTGDTFGLSYRLFDTPNGPYLMPTTTPVQFEPEAWEQTLQRYLSYAPERMYLTHYGCVDNVPALAAELRQGLLDYQKLAQSLHGGPAGERHARLYEALVDYSLAALQRLGAAVAPAVARDWLALDLDLNAQGLAVWLDRDAG